jgi:hypothetical protein
MTWIGERPSKRESHRSAGARGSPWQRPCGERYEVIEGKASEIMVKDARAAGVDRHG